MQRRLVVFTVALAACTGPETDLDRFDDLTAKVEIDCGGYSEAEASPSCYWEASARQALQCLNEALASDIRAVWGHTSWDSRLFAVSLDYFIVDREVQVFKYQAESNDSSEPTATRQPTCTGPFQLETSPCAYAPGTMYDLAPDGCP